MKKLPYGISNYEELITDEYYYVDKTPLFLKRSMNIRHLLTSTYIPIKSITQNR